MTEWKGYYVQFGQQFPMEFADLQINIASAQPGVSGSGADIVGNFTLQGSYDSSSSAIKFTKQYEGAHAIYYEGTLSASQLRSRDTGASNLDSMRNLLSCSNDYFDTHNTWKTDIKVKN